jgi:hypothetical protein
VDLQCHRGGKCFGCSSHCLRAEAQPSSCPTSHIAQAPHPDPNPAFAADVDTATALCGPAPHPWSQVACNCPPAWFGGRVYWACTVLYSFDAATGKVQFARSLNTNIGFSMAISLTGAVYLVTLSEPASVVVRCALSVTAVVVCLPPSCPASLSKPQLPRQLSAVVPMVCAQTAYDATTGATLWKVAPVSGYGCNYVIAANGLLYVGPPFATDLVPFQSGTPTAHNGLLCAPHPGAGTSLETCWWARWTRRPVSCLAPPMCPPRTVLHPP